MPFCWIHEFLFYKGKGKEDGVGDWGLTGTPINMSSCYLRNEFFLSLELRRHSETTLPYGVSPKQMFSRTTCMITNVKKKEKLDQTFRGNVFIVAKELFPFLMKRLLRNKFQGQFVPLHYVSLLCIILHEICTPTYAKERFLILFFLPGRKIVIAT